MSMDSMCSIDKRQVTTKRDKGISTIPNNASALAFIRSLNLRKDFCTLWLNFSEAVQWPPIVKPTHLTTAFKKNISHALLGWHNKFNRQVRVDKPQTYLLTEELKEESLTVELELKEISAGFSTLNKRFKYEKVNLRWGRAWDRLDQDPSYSQELLNMAYHMLPATEDDSCSEDSETGDFTARVISDTE